MRQQVDLDRQRGQGDVEHRPGLGGLLLPGGDSSQYREISNGNRPLAMTDFNTGLEVSGHLRPGSFSAPPLTTVDIHPAAIGRHLAALVLGEQQERHDTIIFLELIVRESA